MAGHDKLLYDIEKNRYTIIDLNYLKLKYYNF